MLGTDLLDLDSCLDAVRRVCQIIRNLGPGASVRVPLLYLNYIEKHMHLTYRGGIVEWWTTGDSYWFRLYEEQEDEL